MGANDKVAATFHGGEYTPSVNDLAGKCINDDNSMQFTPEAFERAIAKIRSEAKAEALREAADRIDSLDSDVEMYNEELQATQVTYWLRARAEQYKEEQ